MTSFVLRFALLSVAAVHLSACTYSLSPMQRREVTTQVLRGSYQDVYRATLTVVQDEGYQVERTDLESGLLRATRAPEPASGGGQLLGVAILAAAILLDDDDDAGRGGGAAGPSSHDLSCIVTPVDSVRTEVRALLVRSDGNVYEPAFYHELFARISVEVERRSALGRAGGDDR